MTDFVSGLRQAIQDLLIPEFRSLQTEVRNLGERLERHEAENARQFQAIHERFESLTREMNERFERVDQRFERVDQRFEVLTKTVATMDGKLDILVEHIVGYKEVARLSVRMDQLERQMREVDVTLRTLQRSSS